MEDKRRREIVVAKTTGKRKKDVMIKKKNLKAEVYIEKVLTRKEREIQSMLTDCKRKKGKRGKKAIVRYMKIYVEQKW